MNDIMLDLETLDTKHSSVILSIGAVRFDIDASGTVGDTFYRVIDIDSNLENNRTVSGRTLEWWMERDEASRAALYGADNPAHLYDALDDLSKFIQPSDRVWGNGAAFDNVIVTDAYRTLGIPNPWPYYNDMCFRTIRNLFGKLVPQPVFEGVKHNSLDDAVHQAKHLQAIMAAMRSQTAAAPLAA